MISTTSGASVLLVQTIVQPLAAEGYRVVVMMGLHGVCSVSKLTLTLTLGTTAATLLALGGGITYMELLVGFFNTYLLFKCTEAYIRHLSIAAFVLYVMGDCYCRHYREKLKGA